MSDAQKKLEEFAKILEAKKIELIEKKQEVRDFLSEDHESSDVEEYQKAICELTSENTGFLKNLIQLKKTETKQSKEIEELYKEIENLNDQYDTMNKDLKADLIHKGLQDLGKSKIEHVKNVTLIASLGMSALGVSERTFDPRHMYFAEEIIAGASAGAVIGYWGQLRNIFRSCAKYIFKGAKRNATLWGIVQAPEARAQTAIKNVCRSAECSNTHKEVEEWYGHQNYQRRAGRFLPSL